MSAEFRYRPAANDYAPLGANIIVELVRDSDLYDKNLRPLALSGLIVPETMRKEGWQLGSPLVRAVACGPDVKAVRPGQCLLVPQGVANSMPKMIYRGPRGTDLVFIIGENNVGTVLNEEQAAEALAQARATE